MARPPWSWIFAVPVLACAAPEPQTSEPSAAQTEAGLRMPAAKEFVALGDPSYGYASFADGAPSQGEVAPDFELWTHTGERLRLHDALAEGPVLLMVYRGFW